MKLHITPTDRIEMVEGAPCRVWTGETDSGTQVKVWIRMLQPQTHDPAALAVFDREMKSLPKVRKELVSFDMRFIV